MVAKYCIERVCMSVSQCVWHVSIITCPGLTTFSVHVCYPWPWLGPPLSTVLRTSGFVDDIIFSCNGSRGRNDNQRDWYFMSWLHIRAPDDIVWSILPGGSTSQATPCSSTAGTRATAKLQCPVTL